MRFQAEIDIMPLKELLDPQGKAVKLGLKNLDIQDVADVRVGKHITMQLDATSKEDAHEKVDTACKKLLANLIMESYEFSLEELK